MGDSGRSTKREIWGSRKERKRRKREPWGFPAIEMLENSFQEIKDILHVCICTCIRVCGCENITVCTYSFVS